MSKAATFLRKVDLFDDRRALVATVSVRIPVDAVEDVADDKASGAMSRWVGRNVGLSRLGYYSWDWAAT